MRPAAAGAKVMSPFCFFAVCFLVFSFTAVLVLFLLEQDDGPSVPRRTMPAADEARAGRGPRETITKGGILEDSPSSAEGERRGPRETITKGGILEDSPSSAEGERSRQAPRERAADLTLCVDDVLGSEVALAERGDLRRRHVAARRLELRRAAAHGQATATEQPPLPPRILRCCVKVKINLVLKYYLAL